MSKMMNPNAKPFVPSQKPVLPPPKPTVGKKEAATKIINDEGGQKGHSIKSHLLKSPVSENKGISKQALEKRTTKKATPTVTAFTKPSGMAKAVKTAMNHPDYKEGTAQKLVVPLTPHKSTGKLPTAMVASKKGPTQKMGAKEAVVEFGEGGRLFRAFPVKQTLTPQTPRTTPKPQVKVAPKTLTQMSNKGK